MTKPAPSLPESAISDEPGPLSPAAKRALDEAAERRKQAEHLAQATPSEVGGRGGLDPIRYGDWEKGGLAVDF